MKGSDLVKMNINIGGEILRLDVDFNHQNEVRDAEREVRSYMDKLKKSWPDASDRTLLAMAAYQFAEWYLKLNKIQTEAIDSLKEKCRHIEEISSGTL